MLREEGALLVSVCKPPTGRDEHQQKICVLQIEYHATSVRDETTTKKFHATMWTIMVVCVLQCGWYDTLMDILKTWHSVIVRRTHSSPSFF